MLKFDAPRDLVAAVYAIRSNKTSGAFAVWISRAIHCGKKSKWRLFFVLILKAVVNWVYRPTIKLYPECANQIKWIDAPDGLKPKRPCGQILKVGDY